jgi:predicted transcriptional regulator
MTKLLEEAIAKVRELPAEQQDEAAEVMLSVARKADDPVRLDDDTRAAVRRGVEQARRGEFVSDEELTAFLKRNRL